MSNKPLRKLNQKHRLICVLISQGRTRAEACEIVGFSVDYWDSLQKDPLIQQELSRQKSEILNRMADDFTNDPIRARLKEIAPKAVSRIECEIDNEDATPKDRLQASEMALSKSGYVDKTPSVTAQQTNIKFKVSDETLKRILEEPKPIRPFPNVVTGEYLEKRRKQEEEEERERQGKE